MTNFISKIRKAGSLVSLLGAVFMGSTANAQTPLTVDDDAMLGKTNAPATMIWVGDYQSPYSRRFWNETLPKIKDNYISQGDVRLVFRDFPIEQMHPGDMIAAQAAEAVRAQGGDVAYWKMQDKIFTEQNLRDSGTTNGPVTKDVDFSLNDLKQWAQSLGYNIDTALDTQQFKAEVEKDLNDVLNADIQGVPAFVIQPANNRYITLVGAQSYAVFRDTLDKALGHPVGIEGKVLFWNEATRADGTVTNEFAPGETFTLTVYGDNRGLNGQKTAFIRWNILTSLDVTSIQPENNQHYGKNDFFYSLLMNGDILETKNTGRAGALNPDTLGLDGIADSTGIVAKYTISVPENAEPGEYALRMAVLKVESDGDVDRVPSVYEQTPHARNFSVAVKSPAEERPVVALTSNRDSDYVIHVAAHPDYTVELSRSYDLTDWYSVASGKGSFDWVDNDAASKGWTFYRATGAKASPSGGGGGGSGNFAIK